MTVDAEQTLSVSFGSTSFALLVQAPRDCMLHSISHHKHAQIVITIVTLFCPCCMLQTISTVKDEASTATGLVPAGMHCMHRHRTSNNRRR
jgi:hypothetical protein